MGDGLEKGFRANECTIVISSEYTWGRICSTVDMDAMCVLNAFIDL